MGALLSVNMIAIASTGLSQRGWLMKPETKQARIAALLGLELPKTLSPREARRRGNVSREAEAVILYAEEPSKFLKKFCRICKRDFAVNRSHIAFCSDDCRSVHINEVLGLEWDPNGRSPEERWSHQTGGSEPLIVPPDALPLLLPAQATALVSPEEFDLSLPDIDSLLLE